jgi:hypothetical protein
MIGKDVDVPVIPRWWGMGLSYQQFEDELARRAFGRGLARLWARLWRESEGVPPQGCTG